MFLIKSEHKHFQIYGPQIKCQQSPQRISVHSQTKKHLVPVTYLGCQ